MGGQRVGHAGMHHVPTAVRRFDHPVTRVVDVIDVVAGHAVHPVGARHAVDDIIARQPEHRVICRGPAQAIGTRAADDAVRRGIGGEQRKAGDRIGGRTRPADHGAGGNATAVFVGPDLCPGNAGDQGFSGISPSSGPAFLPRRHRPQIDIAGHGADVPDAAGHVRGAELRHDPPIYIEDGGTVGHGDFVGVKAFRRVKAQVDHRAPLAGVIQRDVVSGSVLHVDGQLDLRGVAPHEFEIEFDPRLMLPVRLVGEQSEYRARLHVGGLHGPSPCSGGGDLGALNLAALIGTGRSGWGPAQDQFDGTIRADADIVVRPLHDA